MTDEERRQLLKYNLKLKVLEISNMGQPEKYFTYEEVKKAIQNKLPAYLSLLEHGKITYEVLRELDTISPLEKLEFGALYQDANGKLWQRTHGASWFKIGDKTNYSHDVPVRPLTRVKLVKDE